MKKINSTISGSLFILLAVLICNDNIKGQDSSQTLPEFTVGAFGWDRYNLAPYDSYYSSGMNTIVKYADNLNKSYLDSFKVIAYNDTSNDWINHYATGFYSKWEAEQNVDTPYVGVKHEYGQEATWKGVQCWSTIYLSTPKDSLVFGPHYRQEKEYKRWRYGTRQVYYTARFRMALDTNSVSPNEEVCRITVRVRHAKWVNGVYTGQTVDDTLAGPHTMLVSDFPSNGSFKDFLIQDYTYLPQYPEHYLEGKMELPADGDTTYTDSKGNNGIQFCVEWLRDDTLCTLYIDYIDVYDNNGWDDFINDPNKVVDSIQAYAQRYADWDNIIYWFGHDEPFSLDAYIPMRTVDLLLNDESRPPLITEFYPDWRIFVNSDSHLVRYYKTVKPEKLMIDIYPITKWSAPPLWVKLESLREQFTISHSLQPGFWYVGQGFGYRSGPTGNWVSWRLPDSTELKSTVMLALAHGVKGLLFWTYLSYQSTNVYVQGIVNENLTHTEVSYVIKNNFVPRLKGVMGKKLLGLDYTGNYLQLRYITPTDDPPPQAVIYNYLTLGTIPSATDQNWHVGFMESSSPVYSDDKYFLLANLWPNLDRSTNIKVTPPDTAYSNYRFRNFEPGFFDTTFTSYLNYQLSHPKGEGYLYEVAPVVKYGGKLITNDTLHTSINLIDDMTIRTGATVTINDGITYTVLDTVKLEGTGFISGDGYFDIGTDGWIILDSWDYSVFKGREGDHPKIQWGAHPTIENVISYKVYRDKATSGWQHLVTVSGSTFEYIDSTVTIITGPPQGNEVAAHYYVTAVYRPSKLPIETDPSNTITYRRVEGQGYEKRGTGKTGEIYTYNLNQNYPNPFNPSTTIEYSLERDGNMEIEILDILGRRILLLVNEHKQKGDHTVVFNASNLSSGIYFYRIKSGKFVQTKKMILIK